MQSLKESILSQMGMGRPAIVRSWLNENWDRMAYYYTKTAPNGVNIMYDKQLGDCSWPNYLKVNGDGTISPVNVLKSVDLRYFISGNKDRTVLDSLLKVKPAFTGPISSISWSYAEKGSYFEEIFPDGADKVQFMFDRNDTKCPLDTTVKVKDKLGIDCCFDISNKCIKNLTVDYTGTNDYLMIVISDAHYLPEGFFDNIKVKGGKKVHIALKNSIYAWHSKEELNNVPFYTGFIEARDNDTTEEYIQKWFGGLRVDLIHISDTAYIKHESRKKKYTLFNTVSKGRK